MATQRKKTTKRKAPSKPRKSRTKKKDELTDEEKAAAAELGAGAPPGTTPAYALPVQFRNALLDYFDNEPMPAKKSRPFIEMLSQLKVVHIQAQG